MNKQIKLWQSILSTVLVAAVILTGVFVYVGKLRSGVEQLYDGAQQLADGSNQIKDGLSQVSDGTGSLDDGLKQYTDGVSQVDGGLGTLQDGLGTYTDGVAQVDDGLGTLQDGLKTYTGGVKQLDGGLGTLQDGLTTYTGGVEQVDSGVATLQSGLSQYTGGVATIKSGTDSALSQAAIPTFSAFIGTTDPKALSEVANKITAEALADKYDTAYGYAKAFVIANVFGGDEAAFNAVMADESLASDEATLAATSAAIKSYLVDNSSANMGAMAAVKPFEGTTDPQLAAYADKTTQELLDMYAQCCQAEGAYNMLQSLVDATNAGTMPGLNVAQAHMDGLLAAKPEIQQGMALKATAQSGVYGAMYTAANGVTATTIAKTASDKTAARAKRTIAESSLGQYPKMIAGLAVMYKAIYDVNDGAGQLVAANPTLMGGISQLKSGTGQLAGANASIMDGIGQLHGGSMQLVQNNGKIMDGLGQLKDGTGQLTANNSTIMDGLSQLKDGTSQLVANNDALLSGSSQLSDGSGQLYDGSQTLSDGLGTLVDGVHTLLKGVGGK